MGGGDVLVAQSSTDFFKILFERNLSGTQTSLSNEVADILNRTRKQCEAFAICFGDPRNLRERDFQDSMAHLFSLPKCDILASLSVGIDFFLSSKQSSVFLEFLYYCFSHHEVFLELVELSPNFLKFLWERVEPIGQDDEHVSLAILNLLVPVLLEQIPESQKKDILANFRQPGLPAGVENEGNTCFLGGCLQILSHVSEFSQNLIDISGTVGESIAQKNQFMHSLCDLLSMMKWSIRTSVSPKSFMNTLAGIEKSREFANFRQHDASEFLMHVLNVFDDSDEVLKNCVRDAFGGTMSCKVQCAACQSISSGADERFLDISLSFKETGNKNKRSLQNMVNQHLEPEILSENDGNAYYCEKCLQHTNAKVLRAITTPPKVLLLTLKRFFWNMELSKRLKICDPVVIEKTLNLPVLDAQNQTYHVNAFISHIGNSAQYGHYVAYSSYAADQWVKMNDREISKGLSWNDVISQINNGTNTGYVVVLRRSDTLKNYRNNVNKTPNSIPLKVLRDNLRYFLNYMQSHPSSNKFPSR